MIFHPLFSSFLSHVVVPHGSFFQFLYPLDIIIINNIFHPLFYKFSSHLVVSCEIRHEMEWKLVAMFSVVSTLQSLHSNTVVHQED